MLLSLVMAGLTRQRGAGSRSGEVADRISGWSGWRLKAPDRARTGSGAVDQRDRCKGLQRTGHTISGVSVGFKPLPVVFPGIDLWIVRAYFARQKSAPSHAVCAALHDVGRDLWARADGPPEAGLARLSACFRAVARANQGTGLVRRCERSGFTFCSTARVAVVWETRRGPGQLLLKP